MKNADIEDVLSSIRRLVSEDVGAQRFTPKPAPDRLVLTPSQRVTEPQSDSAPKTAAEETDPEPVLLTQPMSTEASGEEAADEAAPVDLSRMVEEEIATALKDFAHSEEDEAEGTEQGEAEEAHDSDAEDTAEPAPEEEKESEPEMTEEAAASEPEEAPEDPPAVHAQPMPSLEQKVAELEAMIAQSGGDWESDAPGDGDNAAFLHEPDEPMAWQDYSEPEDTPVSDARVAYLNLRREAEDEDGSDDTADLGADEAPMLDEEMLRDMVADIVRQELQGALGERITRNVRKLVRREIHRALISQQLD
ncbi:hypothetical protein ACOXXX_19125 [Thalassococcus sp. BH17M4-6]|uniref:hypothetical protein n=1 Tax=Thalassococcus sp. BH17M4-6 TaxID=3413148 RepID=UPI003BE83266